MTTTPLPPKKPEALRIADELDCHNANLDRRARKELRRQHAEIEQLTQARADLDAELDALGSTNKQHVGLILSLEAENQRLREALATLQMQCNSLAASNWREWQELASPQEFERWAKSRAVHMAALARAALENTK